MGGLLGLSGGNATLRRTQDEHLAVSDFLGGRTDLETYLLTSPVEMLPTGSDDDEELSEELQRRKAVLIHGNQDFVVPMEQDVSFEAAAARAGLPCEFHRVPQEGHFEILEPGSASWRQSIEAMEAYFEQQSERNTTNETDAN